MCQLYPSGPKQITTDQDRPGILGILEIPGERAVSQFLRCFDISPSMGRWYVVMGGGGPRNGSVDEKVQNCQHQNRHQPWIFVILTFDNFWNKTPHWKKSYRTRTRYKSYPLRQSWGWRRRTLRKRDPDASPWHSTMGRRPPEQGELSQNVIARWRSSPW